MSSPLLPLDEDALPGSFTPIVSLPEEEPAPAAAFDDVDSAFDPKFREDFIGLLYLGMQEKEIRHFGHRFLLRTPGQADRLRMGEVHKQWANTVQGEYAWRMIYVAGFLRRIDDEQAPEPLKGGPGEGLVARFRWVLESIESPVVIDTLFNECLNLELSSANLIEALDDVGES